MYNGVAGTYVPGPNGAYWKGRCIVREIDFDMLEYKHESNYWTRMPKDELTRLINVGYWKPLYDPRIALPVGI